MSQKALQRLATGSTHISLQNSYNKITIINREYHEDDGISTFFKGAINGATLADVVIEEGKDICMATNVKRMVVSIFGIALVLMLSIFATGCGQGAKAAGKYIAGTYTGEGQGMAGIIEVTLTVDENNITSVDEITDPGETAGIGGKEAIENGTFSAQIMEAQSADIDGQSGAIITSDGVREAVESALAQAANPDYTAQ